MIGPSLPGDCMFFIPEKYKEKKWTLVSLVNSRQGACTADTARKEGRQF